MPNLHMLVARQSRSKSLRPKGLASKYGGVMWRMMERDQQEQLSLQTDLAKPVNVFMYMLSSPLGGNNVCLMYMLLHNVIKDAKKVHSYCAYGCRNRMGERKGLGFHLFPI